MEIAHGHAGVLRVIAKFVLLGLLVVLLAKAILALVALAVLGFVVFVCARAVYLRKTSLLRIAAWTKEILVHNVATAFRSITAIALILGWILMCACRALCGVLSNAARIILWMVMGSLLQCTKLLASGLLAVLFYGKRSIGSCAHVAVRGSARVTRTVVAAGTTINKVSGTIWGTFVEVACGVLVGAILLNLKTVEGLLFLPAIDDIGARACAAALVGAFLGITLGLSRAAWSSESQTKADSN